jgi:hypothetical protein
MYGAKIFIFGINSNNIHAKILPQNNKNKSVLYSEKIGSKLYRLAYIPVRKLMRKSIFSFLE